MNERDLFVAAVEKPSSERAAYLDQVCAGDPAMRRRIDVLLKAHDERGDFLKTPAAGQGAQPDPEEGNHPGTLPLPARTPPPWRDPASVLTERPGTRIGPFKILQKIGQGGFGVVYMAEQEEPVHRRVALKVILPGMDTGQVVARFEAERQALAMMDHQNIAKVLDAGATESGRPYFAMELVKGIPFTQYCDQNKLSPRERLELFVPICHAIQHAHQKGIIHRDIKPSNVLVTLYDGKPVPKVIDFGIAKAIDQRLTERTMFTQFGFVMGTLEYMSPEQAELSALDIDTRSDVYSLGVMLYELLTGTTPLERAKLRTAAYSEMLRRIREEDPPKPSARLSDSRDALPSISAQRKMEPARLTKLVRGDLDWIVMKALEKDRTRRYETANGFAKDIRRYLDGEPVEAFPPSGAYKLKKLARKHRAALATIGAFAFLLLAATAVSTALAVWANRERIRAVKAEDAANEQKKRAEEREQLAIDAVNRYGDVVRKTPELKNNPALAPLRARLLKEAQAFFKRLRDRLQADRETTADSLARLASASFDLGDLTNEIGDKQDALRAYEESLAIRARLARESPAVTQFQSDLADSHNYIGQLQRETGRTAEALASHEQARTIRARLARENPAVTQFQNDLAWSNYNIGALQSDMGRTAEALASYEQARTIRERLAREHPESPDFAHDLGGTLNNIAMIDLDQRRFDQASAKLSDAIHWQRKALAANPNHPTYRLFLTNHLRNLVRAANGLGRADEAAKAQRELEELKNSDPRVIALDARLAAVLKGKETPKDEAERVQFAIRAYEKALHVASARLYAEALANDPKLAVDRQVQHRYNAACAAALAASGQGKDDPPPDNTAKAKLRRQAREWLQADLAAWAKVLDAGQAKTKPKIAPTLKHWKADTDLTGIRDEKELAKLPDEERAAFKTLWNDVDQLLTKAAGNK